MNGLKFIRKQCNFSLSGLANHIGVSRQMISAWENGTKTIPPKRKTQLANFFGISEEFFGEISEKEKQFLLDKAMFSYNNGDEQSYRYIPENEKGKQVICFMKEREQTIDEELIECSKKNKDLLDRIQKNMISCKSKNIRDEITSSYRVRSVLENILDSYEECFKQSSTEKMMYWRVLSYVSEAVKIAYRNDDNIDEHTTTDQREEFILELSRRIKQEIDKQVNVIKCTQTTDSFSENKKIQNKEVIEKTITEKISEAERQYKEFKKENIDTNEFHVII